MTTPPRKLLERHSCDEDCRCCPQCYRRTGENICDKVCEHRERICPSCGNEIPPELWACEVCWP